MTLLDHFDNKWHFLMINIFMLNLFKFTFLQLFGYFYQNFCFEKLLSDMVPTFQRDHVGKMYFDIVFNKCLHHIEMLGPCQTIWIFQICFLGLSWHHGPQKKLCLGHCQNQETRNRNCENLNINIFLTKTFDENPSIFDNKTSY